uniref:38.7K protein n=1 Tax=Adoxophyes orana granulovirus TaxID=170617 RepID=A0A0A7V4X1_GVAO|nr:38.7K protein [Adoxophyes orana granulovirus]
MLINKCSYQTNKLERLTAITAKAKDLAMIIYCYLSKLFNSIKEKFFVNPIDVNNKLINIEEKLDDIIKNQHNYNNNCDMTDASSSDYETYEETPPGVQKLGIFVNPSANNTQVRYLTGTCYEIRREVYVEKMTLIKEILTKSAHGVIEKIKTAMEEAGFEVAKTNYDCSVVNQPCDVVKNFILDCIKD